MDVITRDIQFERIREIMAGQSGMVFTSDLAKFNIPRAYLAMLERNGEIERASRGVYVLPDSIEDEMFIFQSTYQASIFSHETAHYLHDLTDRSPLAYSITLPSGYHAASLYQSGHKVFYVNRDLFDLGVAAMDSPHGNKIRATGLERTICDVARSRNQLDVQVVNAALKRYAAKKEKNLDLLYAYAGRFGVQKIIRNYMEILL